MITERTITKTAQDETQINVLVSEEKIQSLKKVAAKLAVLTGIGILGRVLLQYIPSVEPITAMSIAFSFFLGPVYGIISGTLGYYLSNFLVWGGQGPWTLFQVVGIGGAALIAGIIGRISQRRSVFLFATTIGVVMYEFIVDLSWGFTFGNFNPFVMFGAAIPFSITHLTTTIGFAILLFESKDKLVDLLASETRIIKMSRTRLVGNTQEVVDISITKKHNLKGVVVNAKRRL